MASESEVPTGPIFATRLAYKYHPKPTFAVEYGPTRECDSSELRTFQVRGRAPATSQPPAPRAAARDLSMGASCVLASYALLLQQGRAHAHVVGACA